MNTLVVGGTHGLGFELAETLMDHEEEVITGLEVMTVGRSQHEKATAAWQYFDLAGGELASRVGDLVMRLPHVDRLIYAAGFYQEGYITDLSDQEVDDMLDVCGRGLIFFTKKILEKQDQLDELVTITSTSQWRPRPKEPVYNFAKAGAAHYNNALSLDPRVGKTLVAAPSGMQTPFWDETGKDTSHMLDASWVAHNILLLLGGEFGLLPLHNTDTESLVEDYSYCEARILGAVDDLPNRVEIVETRA